MNVVFDGENLLIKVSQEVTTLDIQTDIYSVWKEWMQEGDNSKFLPALRTIGGDPTVQEKIVAPTFFLMNGWKIKPYSWNHTLNLIGNLFVDNPETYGSNIVIPPDGNYTVLVNMSTTSDASKLLVGSGVTQQDKEDIAGLINPNIDDVAYDVHEVQEQVLEVQGQCETIEEDTENIRIKTSGKWKITKEGNDEFLIMYDTDDPELIHKKYKLIRNSEGQIVERIPVD